jgi:membrane protein DedA with SNARE-associated domain
LTVVISKADGRKGEQALNIITDLLNQYGYIVLYAALALELIAFPTPGETLMTYCGFLTSQGQLNWILSIATASLGIITGITISYFIGYHFGSPLVEKHGSKIHLGPQRLAKTTAWFEKYGNGLLVIAYFIPGIRHVTGYFSGITRIPYKRFAINAYIGAVIWSGTFISLGRVLGDNWEKYHGPIKKYLIILGIIIGMVLAVIYLFKSFKAQLQSFLSQTLANSLHVFHSAGKIKLVLVGFSMAAITLAVFVGGLIQDFLANEFSQFNEITALMLRLIFPPESAQVWEFLSVLSSYRALLPLCGLILVWIAVKGKSKMLEFRFFMILAFGSELAEELLRRLFHLLNPLSSAGLAFPSEQSFLAIITYGFAAYIVYRHVIHKWVGAVAALLSLTICLSAGIGIIYLGLQKPSDIVAGYAFGSFILCITVVLLEIYRILLAMKKNGQIIKGKGQGKL